MIIIAHIQPIVDVRTGRIISGEALVRGVEGDRIFTPANWPEPMHWVSVDQEVARYIRDDLDAISRIYSCIFLNVSRETLEDDSAFIKWAKIVRSVVECGTVQVVVEITEGITDATLNSRWKELTEIGTELALDDFGDKHSTIERLFARNWDYCKFTIRSDSIIDDISINDLPAINYCMITGVKMIAEQIETRVQADTSKLLGLTWQQGYYHAKPSSCPKWASSGALA